MDYQTIFALTHKAKYNNFIGKTFTNKMKVKLVPDSEKDSNIEKMCVELFFSTGYNGRGNTISITETGNSKFDLELYNGKDVVEIQELDEVELINKLVELI